MYKLPIDGEIRAAIYEELGKDVWQNSLRSMD